MMDGLLTPLQPEKDIHRIQDALLSSKLRFFECAHDITMLCQGHLLVDRVICAMVIEWPIIAIDFVFISGFFGGVALYFGMCLSADNVTSWPQQQGRI